MKQIAVLVVTAMLYIVAATATAASEPLLQGDGSASLRDQVSLDRPFVTLGDIFVGLSAAEAEQRIARAPEPGASVTLDADWAERVARSFGIDWRPRFGTESIRVTRASAMIPVPAQEAALRAAIEAAWPQAAAPRTRLEVLTDTPLSPVHTPSKTAIDVQVDALSIDSRSQRFSAMLVVPGLDPAMPARLPVAGRLQTFVEVPVPSRRMRNGEVIAPTDLVWIEIEQDRGMRTMAATEDDLVGQTPRRSLSAMEPVQMTEVIAPEVLERGTIVSATLRAGPLVITTSARSLEGGAMGDIVRVVNVDSNRTIQAVVTGPDTVEVPLGSRHASLN